MEKLWVILSVLCGNYGFEIVGTEYLGDGITTMSVSGDIAECFFAEITIEFQTDGDVEYGYIKVFEEEEYEYTVVIEKPIDDYDLHHIADFMDNLIKEYEDR